MRIRRRRAPPRSAMLNFLLATAVALVLVLVWRYWGTEGVVHAQRAFGDVQLEWQCESGHAFRMPGQVEPLMCPRCSSLAYHVVAFVCEEHGELTVAARFAVGADGGVRRTHSRVPGGAWVPTGQSLRCPRCKSELRRLPRDPLAGSRRKHKRTGG